MALSFDRYGLPSCCGIGLIPGEPHTECPRCFTRYHTASLVRRVRELKAEAERQKLDAASPDASSASVALH